MSYEPRGLPALKKLERINHLETGARHLIAEASKYETGSRVAVDQRKLAREYIERAYSLMDRD